MKFLSAFNQFGIVSRLSLCQFQTSFLPKRFAGFQAAQSNLSMEVKLRLIERKKKKVEKLIKQPLEKIPITDFYIPYSWKLKHRKRNLPKLSNEEAEKRILLKKAYARYTIEKRKYLQWRQLVLVREKEKALWELKEQSSELYEEAIKCVDLTRFDFSCRGPVQTMPLNNYLPPLGSYLKKDPAFSTDEPNIPDS